MEARGGEVGLDSGDFRRVKAKTKCSAWDEMEAEPWPPGSSSRLRRGRNDQTKRLFWNHFQTVSFQSHPRLHRRGRNRVCAGPCRLPSAGKRARQPPAAPSPASPPNMSDVEESLARQPPSKHGCLFKEKPQKREHVGPTCRRSL